MVKWVGFVPDYTKFLIRKSIEMGFSEDSVFKNLEHQREPKRKEYVLAASYKNLTPISKARWGLYSKHIVRCLTESQQEVTSQISRPGKPQDTLSHLMSMATLFMMSLFSYHREAFYIWAEDTPSVLERTSSYICHSKGKQIAPVLKKILERDSGWPHLITCPLYWQSSLESPGLNEKVVVLQKKRLPFPEEMRGDMIAGY